TPATATPRVRPRGPATYPSEAPRCASGALNPRTIEFGEASPLYATGIGLAATVALNAFYAHALGRRGRSARRTAGGHGWRDMALRACARVLRGDRTAAVGLHPREGGRTYSGLGSPSTSELSIHM